jgi:pilus assembly protein CpaB
MERKSVLVPAASALICAALYLGFLASKERALSGAYEESSVLVARADIPERTVLKTELVDVLSVPRKFMQQDAFEVRTPSDLKMIVNLVARVRIPKGNQITQSSLISLSPDAGLSLKVPPGYRGAVLSVEPGMQELLKPGDRVDVLATFDAVMAEGRREKVTATILQNVLVLSVGANLGQGQNAGQAKAAGEREEKRALFADRAMISVALNSSELQYLALMTRQAELTVGVRGLGDREMHPIPIASVSSLFTK